MEIGSANPARDWPGQDPASGKPLADAVRSDGEWVRLAVRHFERRLVAYAASLVGDPDRARDIVQEAFLRLCSQERARVEPHLAEWLFRVCRNLAIDIRRKERRMGLLSDEQASGCRSADQSPGEAVEQVDAFAAALSALEQLPPNQRECIRLKFQQGLSYKEISAVTELSVSNVGFLIHTGIKTLRSRLGDGTPRRKSRASEAR